MKNILFAVTFALILLAGCKQEPWGQISPSIGDIQSSKTDCFYGEQVSLSIEPQTPNNEDLKFLWLCSEGQLLNKTEPEVIWEAPALDGNVTIIVIATNQSTGKEIKKSLTMKVSRAPAANTEEGSFSVDPASGDITIGNSGNPNANAEVYGANIGIHGENIDVVGTNIGIQGENIEVLGTLFGAARDMNGNALKIVTGETKVEDWVYHAGNPANVYVDVDTSAGGFTETPFYFTNLTGNGYQSLAIGSSNFYSSSATGFRVYISSVPARSDMYTLATTYNWTIKWLAVGR